MSRILLSSLLNFELSDLSNWKVRLNKQGSGKTAFENYLNNDEDGKFDRMTLWCEQRSMIHAGEKLIGFARLTHDDYLLVRIYEIIDENFSIKKSDERYKYKILSQYEHLFGRVIIRVRSGYDKSYPVIKLEKLEADPTFEVLEIKPSVVEDNGFKGYDHVRLTYDELKRIVDRKPEDWINALSNQQAVYLITDLNTGDLYVGSATSKDKMLLDRWVSYASNGHGGNKELLAIVNDLSKGFGYIKKHFQYSILENYNSRIDSEYVKKREQYWKKVLDSVKHGLNDN